MKNIYKNESTNPVTLDTITSRVQSLALYNFKGSEFWHVSTKLYTGIVKIYWSKYSEKIEIDWNFS